MWQNKDKVPHANQVGTLQAGAVPDQWENIRAVTQENFECACAATAYGQRCGSFSSL